MSGTVDIAYTYVTLFKDGKWDENGTGYLSDAQIACLIYTPDAADDQLFVALGQLPTINKITLAGLPVADFIQFTSYYILP